jgi:FlaA1/EpsC-like NDP-sugar epimerase
MVKTFEHHRPDIVFHAAALKHLPLLERAPGEALKTNIWGTLSVLDAAAQAGVEYFINISTDKAADPTSVLGYSKRLAERLTAEVAVRTGLPYLSVRFGNVLGSRGSVLTGFSAQVAHGLPMTVTHPEVTRYFMTVREAVQLVIQASAIGRGGEVLVLDMGEPVRIADVAKRVAAAAGRPLDIVYTGLRPGEKLHEVLFGGGETDVRRVHPQVSHVAVPPLHPSEVLKLDPTGEAATLISRMQDLCEGESEPPESLLGVLYPEGWEERRRRPWDGPERRRGNRRERVFSVGWDSILDAAHDRAG